MGRISYGLLAALFFSAPAFAHTESTHFRGALTDQAPRLQRAAAFFDDNGPVGPPLETLTREQLQSEYRRLDAERPGIGLGLTLTIAGGVSTFIGAIICLSVAEVAASGLSFSVAAIVVGTIFLGAGVAALIVGILVLKSSLAARRGYGERMDAINTRLDNMDRGAPPGLPPPGYDDAPPPPPPPPPPGATLDNNPMSSILVASF